MFMELGKLQRMKRIRRNSDHKLLIVPMDHGISMGPIQGITCVRECIRKLSSFPINAMILQKGMIMSCAEAIVASDIPVIMHLSAGTKLNPYGNFKVRIGNVKEAVSFGCDGVSIQVEIGHEKEGEMLREAGKVAEDCYKYGMPLLAMMYVGSPGVDKNNTQLIAHAARVGAELGADIVKVSYNDKMDEFNQVVQGCPIPVVIAGGERCNDSKQLIQMIQEASQSGIAGYAIGRNIFQSDSMEEGLRHVIDIIHGLGGEE